ncbi:penicillin-binding protein 2 [Deminuibacter soli]|uniref:penicillin-binding protein 2 n=1 Tax=Deminuibacter soli TaxID=2291815 RepID=UPI0011C1917B|nr:penicillin-binding protein 2 [Deminuibacter soli]
MYNQSRSRIVQIIFVLVFMVILGQLLHLQIFSGKYRLQAENNAVYRKIVYPDRGIIYDRKHKAILENTIMYDLIITPSEIKGTDTTSLCQILNIDTAEFRKRVRDIIFKNSYVKPSVFEPLLSPELLARLNENMYKFPGFSLNERPVRTYPFNVAADVLGYTGEVDTGFLRRHREEGYEMGDYAGMTGMERSYEKALMGVRGVKRYIRDNRSRIQGPYENGAYDTSAMAGKNLYTSIDVELQQLGEKLMNNKVGSIVAIDPRTGGVLCMVSAPTYNPNYLTGNQRRKHFSELFTDPRLPLLNRTVGTQYSPGSTFKTVVGIVGLTEGVINEREMISCSGAFYGCGNGKPKCLDRGTFDFTNAIAVSDNTYFATVYKRIIDQQRYGSADSSLKVFNNYAYTFGLGHKLGIDLPSEKKGNIPISSYYAKIFGSRWVSCNIISNSIGQGEVQTTLAQLANVMAIIANKGWYYTPHLVDSIEGGDEFHLLDSFRVKHYTASHITEKTFDEVQNGMQAVMEFGTGAAAKVPGVVVCGKTGTVQNALNGVKQKDHAFFGAFAPRDNPRIAIAVMCENAGFGASSAAPIASLMIEKYLKDSIAGKERQDKAEAVAKMNLIPERMRRAMDSISNLNRRRDSLKLIKDAQKEMSDTVEVEDRAEQEQRTPTDSAAKPARQQQAPVKKQPQPAGKKAVLQSPATLPPDEQQRKNSRKTKP